MVLTALNYKAVQSLRTHVMYMQFVCSKTLTEMDVMHKQSFKDSNPMTLTLLTETPAFHIIPWRTKFGTVQVI